MTAERDYHFRMACLAQAEREGFFGRACIKDIYCAGADAPFALIVFDAETRVFELAALNLDGTIEYRGDSRKPA